MNVNRSNGNVSENSSVSSYENSSVSSNDSSESNSADDRAADDSSNSRPDQNVVNVRFDQNRSAENPQLAAERRRSNIRRVESELNGFLSSQSRDALS